MKWWFVTRLAPVDAALDVDAARYSLRGADNGDVNGASDRQKGGMQVGGLLGMNRWTGRREWCIEEERECFILQYITT